MQQHEPVGLLIGAARRGIKQAVGRRVRRFRLTPQQFWLMVGVLEGHGTSLREIAERHRMDQPTASRVVAALVRRKLVRVARDAADRRRSRLVCAAAGEALRADLAALAAEIRAAVTQGIGEDDQETARRVLRTVIGNMDRLARDGPGSPSPRGKARRG